MPKTTIDKHGLSLRAKNDVRPPRQIPGMLSISKPQLPHCPPHGPFWLGIYGPDAAHDFAAGQGCFACASSRLVSHATIRCHLRSVLDRGPRRTPYFKWIIHTEGPHCHVMEIPWEQDSLQARVPQRREGPSRRNDFSRASCSKPSACGFPAASGTQRP
jgi:hypothetical protein